MTRIVAGRFRGRRIAVFDDPNVRPTAERIREAWFSVLADRIEGATVLDLYAGTGALGFEALSRGARSVTFVDVNPVAVTAIRGTAAALGIADQTIVLRRDGERFAMKLPEYSFDVCLADPPYGHRAAPQLAEGYRFHRFAGLLCVEHDANQPMPPGDTRLYGDTAITLYQPTP